jgi:hypothetical protein
LEYVNLMGTATGDGAIAALAGKPHLRHFRGGNNVTAAGVALLHHFPVFKTWQGGEVHIELMSPDARPNFLWLQLNHPYLQESIANIEGLDGLFALSFIGASIAPVNLTPLAGLPNLGWLGLSGQLCEDEVMRVIGAMPRLRMLMAQSAIATDDGFTALSRSQTIEYIWGRSCPNLTSRGFRALANMPALRGLAVSFKNADRETFARLPRWPALRELMPMDATDDRFRHIGRCENLEALWCMYCRETTDKATMHIAGLSKLKTYYAGDTQITGRSLEILSRMPSLERLVFWHCENLTDAGVAKLAALPRLKKLELQGGMPQVTKAVTAAFPPHVQVEYLP